MYFFHYLKASLRSSCQLFVDVDDPAFLVDIATHVQYALSSATLKCRGSMHRISMPKTHFNTSLCQVYMSCGKNPLRVSDHHDPRSRDAEKYLFYFMHTRITHRFDLSSQPRSLSADVAIRACPPNWCGGPIFIKFTRSVPLDGLNTSFSLSLSMPRGSESPLWRTPSLRADLSTGDSVGCDDGEQCFPNPTIAAAYMDYRARHRQACVCQLCMNI